MPMLKRRTLLAATALTPLGALAHHGWSSFDQDRPIYLEGRVTRAKWQNPHAELVLEVPAGLKVPADLAQRPVPAQSSRRGWQGLAGQGRGAQPQGPQVGGRVGAADPHGGLEGGRDQGRGHDLGQRLHGAGGDLVHLPVPLMARYLRRAAASALAQLE
jgi:hypothetical protein